jgi:hypothetical protein
MRFEDTFLDVLYEKEIPEWSTRVVEYGGLIDGCAIEELDFMSIQELLGFADNTGAKLTIDGDKKQVELLIERW